MVYVYLHRKQSKAKQFRDIKENDIRIYVFGPKIDGDVLNLIFEFLSHKAVFSSD